MVDNNLICYLESDDAWATGSKSWHWQRWFLMRLMKDVWISGDVF